MANGLSFPQDLPAVIADALGDAVPRSERVGSGAMTIHEFAPRDDWPLQALLIDPNPSASPVADEIGRLSWIGARLPVPQMVCSASLSDGRQAAVLKYPVGSPASAPENRVDPQHSVRKAARALRMVHRTDPDDISDRGFDNRLDVLLPAIEERVAGGRFDMAQLSGPYQRFEPARLVEMLHEGRPEELHGAFGHGSFGLHAVLLDNPDEPGGEVTGITDWARAGTADPYLDLASGARSVASVFGAELLPTFFDEYGLAHPDPLRLDYYGLLIEFL